MSGNSCGQKTDIRENGYGNYYFFHRIEFGAWQFAKEASQLRQGDFQSVLKALQDAYCNTASDPDAYLYETVAPENIIFGLYEPEKVLERLDAWNREIRVEFLRAIKNMCPGIGAGHLPPEDELPMDTDMTYQLVCATRELDDMWYDFADHAVYVENEFGYPFFRTIVDEHTAACIKANPEAYLIARVTPK